MALTNSPATEYQDAARDCAGLLTLLHRALADHAAQHRADPTWAEVNDLTSLRHRLYEALIPTRNCLSEGEALAEIDCLVRQVRPGRV